MIQELSVISGRDKNGRNESVARVDLHMGDVVSVVGPTGSGKTTLINDLELFAAGDTPTGRRVLINGIPAPAEYRDDPSRHPVALITQHTSFLSDLFVLDFLQIHAGVRLSDAATTAAAVDQTLAFANELTGEPILRDYRMTELSGGQTRALLIGDAVIIGNAPIILLDEIENAGIHRLRALELLRQYCKVFVFVTHDPYIPLLSDFRIVMAGGAITRVIYSGLAEQRLAERVRAADDRMAVCREHIRAGGEFTLADVDAFGWPAGPVAPQVEEVAA